jgi:hypothetical protein
MRQKIDLFRSGKSWIHPEAFKRFLGTSSDKEPDRCFSYKGSLENKKFIVETENGERLQVR